jgi:hypothetical protein
MFKIAKQCAVFFLIATLILVPFGATVLAEEKTPSKDIDSGTMIADLVLLRPLGIVATVAGAGLFIASLPFTIIGGNTAQAGEKLFKEPARFTFGRPLGDI